MKPISISSAKRQVIEAMLQANRPDLANQAARLTIAKRQFFVQARGMPGRQDIEELIRLYADRLQHDKSGTPRKIRDAAYVAFQRFMDKLAHQYGEEFDLESDKFWQELKTKAINLIRTQPEKMAVSYSPEGFGYKTEREAVDGLKMLYRDYEIHSPKFFQIMKKSEKRLQHFDDAALKRIIKTLTKEVPLRTKPLSARTQADIKEMTSEDAARILSTTLSQVQYTGQQPRDMFRQLAKAIAKNPALSTFFLNTKTVKPTSPEIAQTLEKWRRSNSFVTIHNLPTEIEHELQAILDERRPTASSVTATLPFKPGDKVKVLDSHGSPEFRGDVGVIEKYVPFNKYYVVLKRNGRSFIDMSDLAKASVVTARPGFAKSEAGTLDYEGQDVGVQISDRHPRVDVSIYYPMENFGKRGKVVEIVNYSLFTSDANRVAWGPTLLRRLKQKPDAKVDEVMRIVRSTLQEAEKESIERRDQYPTKMYEPVKTSQKGTSSALPESTKAVKFEDRRGPDVSVRFKKPDIWIYSKEDTKEGERGREDIYVTVPWFYAKKVNNLADELIKLKGLDAVQKVLNENNVKSRYHRYIDPMWA